MKNKKIDFWGKSKRKFKKRMPKDKLKSFWKPKVTKKKDLTWKQAKKRYPKLNPFGDADKDGVKNKFDCRPFNRRKQGFAHEYSFSSHAEKRFKTVKMPPRRFLKETYKETKRNTTPKGDLKMGIVTFKNAGAPEKFEDYVKQIKRSPSYKGSKEKTAVEAIKKKIKSKKESIPIGFLEYEKGKEVAHEGRHTALAAEELGIPTIPVTVISYVKEKEPKVSNLPLHRKQYVYYVNDNPPPWATEKEKKEYLEDYKTRIPNKKAQIIRDNQPEPEVLQEYDKETEEVYFEDE